MKIIAAIAASAFISALMAAPVVASDQTEYVSHQAECFALLLNDPAAHATECGGPFEFVKPSNLRTSHTSPPVYHCDWESKYDN